MSGHPAIESHAERNRRLAREAAARSQPRPRTETPARFDRSPAPPSKPFAGPPEQMPARAEPAPAKPLPQVEFRKKRRLVPPDEQGPT